MVEKQKINAWVVILIESRWQAPQVWKYLGEKFARKAAAGMEGVIGVMPQDKFVEIVTETSKLFVDKLDER